MKSSIRTRRYLCVLQNAWSSKPRIQWSYRSWKRALRRSRSGQRLAVLFGDLWDSVQFVNTTPDIALDARRALPPGADYVRRCIATCKPEFVVACGRQAESVVTKLWRGPLLVMPHPAHRVLTNALVPAPQWPGGAATAPWMGRG